MHSGEFENLRHDDVPAALRLSTQAGWNQTEADWRRLLDLGPAGAFGLRHGERLVATATLASYGRQLAWIGMVLVDEDHRGQGLGSAILQHVLEVARGAGVATLGLDATDFGRPLYEARGFVAVGGVDRWSGQLRRSTAPVAARELRDEDLEQVAALDRRACGVDRGALLRHLTAEAGVRGWVTSDREGLSGYALLRPGRTRGHLGPLVAGRADDLEALLQAAAEALAGAAVFADAPVFAGAPRQPTTADMLIEAGLHVERRLTRMTQPAARPAMRGSAVRLSVGFEWG